VQGDEGDQRSAGEPCAKDQSGEPSDVHEK
jgi:hypothetical protein